MDKIKRFINIVIPVKACNLKCHYCYVGQNNNFDGSISKLEYDIDYIIKALSKKRLGGPCFMNLCAEGETLLAPYIIELTEKLLKEGHYVAIVTNGMIKNKIQELCELSVNLRKKLFIKFSYHPLELKRLKLTSDFFSNIELTKNSGISYSVELTVNDEAIQSIEEIKKECNKHLECLPHLVESRDNKYMYKRLTKLKEKEHLKIWKSFDSSLLNFQVSEWEKKRKEFCYAGDWSLTLYLANGDIAICSNGAPIIGNIFKNIAEPIKYFAIGNNCPCTHCFAAHVHLTTGNIPELETPTYYELRERKDWIGKDVKAFFSSKLVEANKEYSNNKKRFINALRELENNQYTSKSLSKEIEKELLKKKIKTIAMFSDDKFSNWLQKELKDTKIKIKFMYTLDGDCENNNIKTKLKRKIKYLYKKIRNGGEIIILNKYDKWPSVDSVIITDYLNYLEHAKIIKEKQKKSLLITEIFD